MGACGIGIERILGAAIEQEDDSDGLVMRPSIAPFKLVVVPVNSSNADQMSAAEKIYTEAKDAGIDALLDNRDERPGVKFKDADLIGVPYRVTVGRKVTSGVVELVERSTKQ